MLRIHLIISLSCILNTHQQICYPMHTTDIPILTTLDNVDTYNTRQCMYLLFWSGRFLLWD